MDSQINTDEMCDPLINVKYGRAKYRLQLRNTKNLLMDSMLWNELI